MMETEIKAGWNLLELDAEELHNTGSAKMKFIVESEGERGIVFVDADSTNDAPSKTKVAKMVQELVRKTSAHTVYHTSDTWTATILGHPKDRANLIEYVESIGVKKASDMGLVQRREALACQITTRKGPTAMLRWFYDRDDENQVITMQERDQQIHPSGGIFGKFSHFFE